MASNGIKVDLRGDKELKRLLATLPSRVQKKAMRRAQSKAATPMLAAAKARVPTDTRLLRRSLKKKQKTYQSGKIITVIGPDRNVTGTSESGKLMRPANYSHLVEKGHGGPHPAQPHAFMKPAYTENIAKSEAIMKAELLKALMSEAKKQK